MIYGIQFNQFKFNSFLVTTFKEKFMWKKFEKWFDLNLGWFFINGHKQEAWCEHLKEKYGDK
jgi:hypothetical protein